MALMDYTGDSAARRSTDNLCRCFTHRGGKDREVCARLGNTVTCSNIPCKNPIKALCIYSWRLLLPFFPPTQSAVGGCLTVGELMSISELKRLVD